MDYTYIDKYKEYTGYDVSNHNIDNTMYYSEDYVEWLQEQLKLCVVIDSEAELLCDVEKGTKCKDPFPKYRTGVCRNCGGQSN